jgi:hypothetical protein
MDWDICWSDRSWVAQNFDGMRLEEWQRVNHFRNNYELTRKDHMVKNLKRQRKQLEREGRHEEVCSLTFLSFSLSFSHVALIFTGRELRLLPDDVRRAAGVRLVLRGVQAQPDPRQYFSAIACVSNLLVVSSALSLTCCL